MAYSGKFTPQNPHKYKGDAKNIIWRSTWELKFMRWLDEHPNVLEWSSEERSIPYISPIDNRIHRYFPDFIMKTKDKDGNIVTRMIEIKPEHQTKEPKIQRKITPKYIAEVKTWGVNQAKWKAAERFCEDLGWEFVKLTEKELFSG